MAEMKTADIDGACQGVKQIGTMEGAERRAETMLHARVITIIERDTRVHVARENARSDIGRRGNASAEPHSAQRVNCLRADINPRTDLAETRRCFENLRCEAEFRKCGSGRQSGKAGADNGDVRSLGHCDSKVQITFNTL